MSEEAKHVSDDDLEEQEAELLPDRELMSTIRMPQEPQPVLADPGTYEVSPEDPPPV